MMLSQFYPPTIGGEERHVHDLATEFVARGHDVSVATLWHPGLAEFEDNRGVRVYRLQGLAQRARWLFKEGGRRHAPPWPDPELVLALRRVVERERPEIVHAHNWLVHSFLPLKAGSGARLVLTLHDYSLVCAKKSLMFKGAACSGPGFFKCLSCASAHYGPVKGVPTTLANWGMGVFERAAVDMFITVSQATAQGNGLPGSGLPFEVIPNFLPNTDGALEPGRDEYLTQLPAEPFLLFVGDLRAFKGIWTLVEAYGRIDGAPPLVLIGRVLEDTPSHFPPNVVVFDKWPHGAVMAAWRRSLAGVLPSIGPETFGIAALEAMSQGRPVIVSAAGGLPEVVSDGETGLVVPPGDVEALQNAIERLVAEPGLAKRLGQAAQRRAGEFRAAKVIPRIEQVYRRLLASPTGQPASVETAA